MHKTIAQTQAFVAALRASSDALPRDVDAVVCPPFTALSAASDALRETQERRLKRLAAVCRAQRREWLLEIAAGARDPTDADGLAEDALAGDALERVLSRLYSLDIRPDWWVLESGPASDRWARVAELISCGPSVEHHLAAIDRFVKAGFDHIILTQVGPEQDRFIEFFERRLRPALLGRKAA